MSSAPSPESPLALAWRRWATTRLASVVVHRANNAVAAQLGTLDLAVRERDAGARHAEAAHAAAQELSSFLNAYSRFSKTAGGTPESDAVPALREAQRLVGAVVHEAAGSWDARLPERALAVGLDAHRLEQLVVGLVVTVLADLPPPEDGRGPRVRLRLAPGGPRTLLLRLAFDRPAPARLDELDARKVFAALDGELGALGAGLAARSTASACAFRLRLPALADLHGLEPPPARDAAPTRRRMLVHLSEPMLAELVKDVLAECGVDAESVGTPTEAVDRLAEPGWDLLLLQVDHVGADVLERCRADAGRVAVLASGEAPPGDWHGVLPMPFRPRDLMRLL